MAAASVLSDEQSYLFIYILSFFTLYDIAHRKKRVYIDLLVYVFFMLIFIYRWALSSAL